MLTPQTSHNDKNVGNDCPFGYHGNCQSHYQMKNSPKIRWNTENSIGFFINRFDILVKIDISVMASHLVTMAGVRCKVQAYYFLVPITISRCKVPLPKFLFLPHKWNTENSIALALIVLH